MRAIQRIEQFMFHKDAFREMPPSLNSTEKLFMKHSSKPFNPKLAEGFFKSGMIKTWGRSFEKLETPAHCMMDHCQSMRLMRLELWFCARLVISIWDC